ncbi:DNA gyrase subunit A (plasmid) [Acidithiobacillus ferriphilus]|uniref:DNA gyrase subunit A n=1 Tax=Acidithiobacillus ferriphilus TaxID=1689834 RepID=UPI00390C75B1
MTQPTASFAKNIILRNVEDEMNQSYIDYAMSVIVGRALPDARDGLKPVHRRILYAMNELGNDWNKPYKKSARIVGDVIGKYHPHGDTAVYDAMVRMAQDFSMSHMLIDGQGNFGSVDGDSPAAMRYTEVRLSRIAGELLTDLDKETVAFGPNYDEKEMEPLVLPAAFPNLLVNGSEGIAVGMATKIPPHNLGEVIDACLYLIDHEDASAEDILSIIKGPDFPTRGLIIGHSGARQAYLTGNGRITMRARAEVETDKKGRVTLAITEIPYQANKAKLIETIANLVKEKKIEGISDLRDESDKSGMRIAIELRKEAIPDVVLNNLYKQTALQSNFSVNTVALVNGAPKTLTLMDILQIFVEYRVEIVTKRTQYLLRKANERAHILEGLMVAIDNLDDMIALIRTAANPAEAREQMMAREWRGAAVSALLARVGRTMTATAYHLSEVQAQAILDLRLHRLTGLERDKIEGDFESILVNIAELGSILADRGKLMGVISEELQDIRKKYAVPRRSEIVIDADDFVAEDLIPDDPLVITMSHAGYIKAQDLGEFKSQGRGGRGKQAAACKDGDFVEHLFTTSKHAVLLFFTSTGKAHVRKGYQIPEGGRAARGRPIPNILPLETDERVTTVLAMHPSEMDQNSIIMVTEQGTAKRVAANTFANVRSVGTRAITLREGDQLKAVLPTKGDSHILLFTHNGKAIRFHEDDVREMGKTAAGVRCIRLAVGDLVVACLVARASDKILTVSEDGFGKVTGTEDYRLTARGAQGVVASKKPLAGAVVVDGAEDDVLLLSGNGVMVRMPADSIRETGRTAKGVRLMRLDNGDRVICAEQVPSEKDNTEPWNP